MNDSLYELRYPIGEFDYNGPYTAEQRNAFIDEIASAPAQLREACAGLTDKQLDTPYRPEGWTLRQVVHHLADSHMNAYIRFRLALTEDRPEIRPYFEDRWARLEDAATGPLELSLNLFDPLTARWVELLRSMSAEQFEPGYFHPEMQRLVTLDEAVGTYAWHGAHHIAHITSPISHRPYHIAHITSLKSRMGW